MPGRRAALSALLLAACTAGGPPPRAPSLPLPSPAPPAPSPVRFFHAVPDDSFWVSHAPALDRVIAGGARLELLPSGEVTAAAWDLELSGRGEPLAGALAVPERLGGGFVAWTRAHAFRAREFTGPLEPIAAGVPGDVAVRGARAGLTSVLVFTDAGPRELPRGAPGSRRCRIRPSSTWPRSVRRAARLDVSAAC